MHKLCDCMDMDELHTTEAVIETVLNKADYAYHNTLVE